VLTRAEAFSRSGRETTDFRTALPWDSPGPRAHQRRLLPDKRQRSASNPSPTFNSFLHINFITASHATPTV
jgi:hypothetical protein